MTTFQKSWVLPVRGAPTSSGVDARLGGMTLDLFGGAASSATTKAGTAGNGEDANKANTEKEEEAKGNLPTPPVPPELGGEALSSTASEEHSKAAHSITQASN